MTTSPLSEQVERLLDDAEDALNEGTPETALLLCARALELAPDHPGALFVRGDAYRFMGCLEEAALAYRAAAIRSPGHASSWASLGLACFELLAFPDAEHAAGRAIREDPRNPEGWWVRGLTLEWKGDFTGSRRSFLHARWLDPAGFQLPPSLSEEEIEALVEQTLQQLHPTICDYLSNVPIILEEMPNTEVLQSFSPPASPLELLGFFSGHSLMERSLDNPWSNFPPTIVLFRRNIERHASDRATLIHQLRVTIFHEIGHFIGLDEQDLLARGLG